MTPEEMRKWSKDNYNNALLTTEQQDIGNVRWICEDIIGIQKLTGYLEHPDVDRMARFYPVKVDYLSTARYFIDGDVIMSTTPMELDSHVIVIKKATGRVGVAGLGLGYYIQSILNKENVTHIDVYEINKNSIELYNRLFEHNDKVTIIEQDIRTVEGKKYDFFYCDIYPDFPGEEEAMKDFELLTRKNEIKEYYFWTFERQLALNEIDWGDVPDYMTNAILKEYGDISPHYDDDDEIYFMI